MSEIKQLKEKEELERILGSRHFRGKLIRRALVYLCARRWDNKAEVPTQYDFAQALYSDLNEVEAVRNVASRLRRQLALYYGKGGSGNPLRLEIPLGAYQVEFIDPNASVDLVSGVSELSTKTDSYSRKAQPEKETAGEQNRRAIQSGTRFLKMSLILTTVTILVLIINSAITVPLKPKVNNKAASFVRYTGNELTGWIKKGQLAWGPILMEAPIRGTKKLSTPDESKVHFLVAYGGRGSVDEVSCWVSPKVVIFSSTGKELAPPVNLLVEFNPFCDQVDERLFELKIINAEDLDGNSFDDGIMVCQHMFYPDIIYFISGESKTCTGGFANSGRCFQVKAGAENSNRISNQRFVAVLGMNNRMGYQPIVFLTGIDGFNFSPDILIRENMAEDCRNILLYRLLSNVDEYTVELRRTPTGIFFIDDGGKGIKLNRSASLDTDAWFNDRVGTAAAVQWYENQYELIREAQHLILDDRLEDGIDLYQAALRAEFDELMKNGSKVKHDINLQYSIRMNMVTALRLAGKPDQALEWLPVEPEECINAGSVAYFRGELLLLQGAPGSADHFLNAGSHPCQTGRYEQYVHARILDGASAEEIHSELQVSFCKDLRYPVSQKWLLIPGLLRGEVADSRVTVNSMGFQEPLSGEIWGDHLFYPQQTDFWSALADLEQGYRPRVRPDKSIELAAPKEQQDLVDLRQELLRALEEYTHGSETKGLYLQESIYRKLKEASQRESRAIIPFVYSAYRYGFAALDAGDNEAGSAALTQAYYRYPYGPRAEQAHMKLAELGIEIQLPQ